jgi:hypothetical protein
MKHCLDISTFNGFLLSLLIVLCCVISFCGCGTGDQPAQRNVLIEGEVLIKKNDGSLEVPSIGAFIVEDESGEVRSSVEEGGFFTLNTTPNLNGDSIAFEKYILLTKENEKFKFSLPSLQPKDTLSLKLHHLEAQASMELVEQRIISDNALEPTPIDNSITPIAGNPSFNPLPTNVPEPTSNNGPATPLPSPTGLPGPTSPFDSSGNTTSFGIPAGLRGNISTGKQLYAQKCSSCHGELGQGWSFNRIKTTIAAAPMFIKIPDREVAHITAFLNRRSSR